MLSQNLLHQDSAGAEGRVEAWAEPSRWAVPRHFLSLGYLWVPLAFPGPQCPEEAPSSCRPPEPSKQSGRAWPCRSPRPTLGWCQVGARHTLTPLVYLRAPHLGWQQRGSQPIRVRQQPTAALDVQDSHGQDSHRQLPRSSPCSPRRARVDTA